MVRPRILIIDDENLARQRIARFLSNHTLSFEILEAKNAIEGHALIVAGKPDIIFLDIEMPGMSGIDLLAQIEERDFKLIFATAYDEFALKAFEENACDYLLKPFDQDRLFKAVNRALHQKANVRNLEKAEISLLQRNNFLTQLFFRRNDGIYKIESKDILCFSAEDNYTIAHTQECEFVSSLSLTHLESRLNPKYFVRIHRSSIINLQWVVKFRLGESARIELKNGRILDVSRRKKDFLKSALASCFSQVAR